MTMANMISCNCVAIYSRFKICSKINEKLRQDIKLIHIFNQPQNVLFVTSDDRVFGFGHNKYGFLGFGHNEIIDRPTEVTQLRGKRLREFFVGGDFVVAVSEDSRLFTWGHNDWAQLGRGCVTKEGVYLKAEAIDLPLKETVVQVCCGRRQTLVLTSRGRLYGWGRNEFGELRVPTELRGLEGLCIKKVQVGHIGYYAITRDGRLFGWPCLRVTKSLRQPNEPRLPESIQQIYDSNVVDICANNEETYFLTSNGDINPICHLGNGSGMQIVPTPSYTTFYTRHSNKRKRQKIEFEFNCLHSVRGLATALKDGRVYRLSDDKVSETKHKTFFDYYSIERLTFPKTIALNCCHKMITKRFNEPKTSDFKFKIRRSDGNYDYIYCHKSILSQSSKYFRTMFAKYWTDSQTNEFEITGYSYESFYQYMRWLYTDCIVTHDIDLLSEILAISNQYLDYRCSQHLRNVKNNRNNTLV